MFKSASKASRFMLCMKGRAQASPSTACKKIGQDRDGFFDKVMGCLQAGMGGIQAGEVKEHQLQRQVQKLYITLEPLH